MVMWDRGNRPDWAYPRPHDAVIEELTENVGPGDFYDEVEKVFYRPLSKPPDLPEELADMWPPAPQAIGTDNPPGPPGPPGQGGGGQNPTT